MVLDIILTNSHKAFTHSFFSQLLDKKLDRSTIYRTLDKLTDFKVLNKMVDSNGQHIYSMKRVTACDHHIHPHLKCKSCNEIECLPSYPVEYLNELTSLGVNEFNIIFNGICSKCSNQASLSSEEIAS